MREVDLGPTTRIRYWERGDGAPVVFVHGLTVNADLWRKVVPQVAAAGLRCIAPDWPLGSHDIAVPDADLSPPGVAALIAAFLERLDLHDVTIVANDTGGAITQILMTEHPAAHRPCRAHPLGLLREILPANVRVAADRWPGCPAGRRCSSRRCVWRRCTGCRSRSAGWPSARSRTRSRTPISSRPVAIAAVRRDLSAVPARRAPAAHAGRRPAPARLHQAGAARVGGRGPGVPISLAHRLAAALPDAQIVPIEDTYTFVPEDRPERLAELIVDFAERRAAA